MLAERLQTGASPDTLVALLSDEGVDEASARDWVAQFIDQVAAMGALSARLPPSSHGELTRIIDICGLRIGISFETSALARRLGAVFAQFEAAESGADAAFTVADQGGFTSLSGRGAEVLLVPARHAAIRLKGLVLSEVLGAGNYLTALHAAGLARDGEAVLLLGSPGSGKTMLSLALLARGFEYGGDDVALLRPDGTVDGVPLAPGVKANGWDKAERLGFDLSAPPPHLRPDGLSVRFVCLERARFAGPLRVGTVIKLQRTQAGPAALHPLTPSEALAELMREAQSLDGRCSQQTLQALAEIVTASRCLELHYTESEQAAALLCEG